MPALRPGLTGYRDVTMAYRIALKCLARRYIELHDGVTELDVMIKTIVDDLTPNIISWRSIEYESASQLLITAGKPLASALRG